MTLICSDSLGLFVESNFLALALALVSCERESLGLAHI